MKKIFLSLLAAILYIYAASAVRLDKGTFRLNLNTRLSSRPILSLLEQYG